LARKREAKASKRASRSSSRKFQSRLRLAGPLQQRRISIHPPA
jgi:hypothetical protein